MTPQRAVQHCADRIIEVLDGTPVDIGVVACIDAAVRIVKSATNASTVTALEQLQRAVTNILETEKRQIV